MAAKVDLKVAVEPAKVGFRAPNDGQLGGIVRLKINNTNKERMVFKVKLTNPDRFAVGPPYGFVEPSSSFLIKIKPKTFDASKCPANDHFSVLVAKAPPNVNDAGLVWKKGGPYEPKETKRFVVNAVYCKGNTPLPPIIPDPRAAAKPPAPAAKAAPAPAAAAAPAAKKPAAPATKKEGESSGASSEGSSEASESDEGSEEESEVSEELDE